jgi:hypothetical protein
MGGVSGQSAALAASLSDAHTAWLAGRQDEPPTTSPPRVLLLDAAALVAARQGDDAAGRRALRGSADRALARGPYSVMEKTAVPPSGDRHDYYSIGPYFWPNPDTPNGLPYIQRDGEFNPEWRSGAYDYDALDTMTKAVGTLGVAYYVTGDARYGEHAARLIRTWFLDPATRMNANFRFAQSVPGRPRENGFGIIEARQFIAVAEGAWLLDGAPGWSAADLEALRAWLAAFLDWLQHSPPGQEEARAPNNHGTWHAAQVAAYARFTANDALARQVLAERGPARIVSQIEPDGRQPHELARTRPFHYSVFNLEALTALALLGQPLGVNLWRPTTPDGRSLRTALDYLVPFGTGAAPWPYPDLDTDRRSLALLLARAARGYGAEPYAPLIGRAWPDPNPLQQVYLRLGVWWTWA